MDDLNQKAGFLKGLLESYESADPQEARVICAMADLLSALTDRVCSHDVLLTDLNDYVESIDDDLAALEGEDDFRFDSKEDVCGPADIIPFNRSAANEPLDFAENDMDETETFAGRVCPDCRAIFLVSADDDPSSAYRCPSCKNRVRPLMLTPETARPVRPEV